MKITEINNFDMEHHAETIQEKSRELSMDPELYVDV